MAYAALLSLNQTLDNILFSQGEFGVLDKVQIVIKSLREKLSLFISFLEETNSQRNTDLTEDLEERIRDAVYEAEDIVESHMSKQSLSECESRFLDCARWFFLSICNNNSEKNEEDDLEKRKYENDLKSVMTKLDSIWGEVENMKDNDNNNNIERLQIRDPLTRPVNKLEGTSKVKVPMDEIEEVKKMHPRKSSSLKYASTNTNTSSHMVGFEANMRKIKELLDGPSTKLEIISIVGMGGIGKTTLARNIYNNSFVNDHFDLRAWTTVSQKYDVMTLIIDLLKSTGNPTDGTNKEELKQKSIGNPTAEAKMGELKLKLYQSLKQRRYFVVMDDIWDTEFLKEFKKILPDDNNGSRIIMTSRSSEVANFEHSSNHIHRMDFLSPEQSWNLLCDKALGEEPCPPALEEIGRKIAKKCKGLPLALAVIGGLLYKGKKTREHWNYVEGNMKSAEVGNYDDLLEVLSWSYDHLPHHLKVCLLYMGIYPEDYVIHISHLIRLWLAEGFVKPIPTKNLEQVAKEYLEDLIARNLIMVRDRNYYGEIKTCTIHDLMRVLCRRKAWEKMFLYVADNYDEEVIGNQRCLSIHRRKRFRFGHWQHPTVRSLIYFRLAYELPMNFPLQLLRVLDACNIKFNKFPTQIVKLVNLRYLAFFLGRKGKIPTSISRLYNLQTLIVIRHDWKSEARILYLPPEMLKNMPWLRHLLVDGSSFLSYPCGTPNWNLQVLSGMINFRFTEEAIEKILDLKTLKVVYRNDRETDWSFYCMENVVHLHQLENLKFHFRYYWYPFPLNLRLPQELKKLTLSSCQISSVHASSIGSLPNLQVLKLKDVEFENNEWKTNEGEFIELKFLLIRSSWLGRWEAEETHFRSLECLSLYNCRALKCIPQGIGEIPTLRDIVLYECPSRVVDSTNEMLKEQQEFGYESFQLHVYSWRNDKRRSGVCFHKRYNYDDFYY